MRLQYVKTSNHQRFMAGVAAIENRGSAEACIALLTGEPGTGKTRAINYWGSERFAVNIEGVPGMTLGYLRDAIAFESGVKAGNKFAQQRALVEYLGETRRPIILDEAQHGLGNHAECIEYLRRIAEQASVPLVLVCHTSEKHKFSEHKLAHIATRISAVVTLQPANAEDCQQYLGELCEVGLESGIAALVHEQSRGRYRLMANACKVLEAIARKQQKTGLALADVKSIRLCEDVARQLARGKA